MSQGLERRKTMLKKFKEKYNAMSVEVRASVAYMVCNILQRCMSFLTMPLFTRLMSAEEFGQFTVSSSWCFTLSGAFPVRTHSLK